MARRHRTRGRFLTETALEALGAIALVAAVACLFALPAFL